MHVLCTNTDIYQGEKVEVKAIADLWSLCLGGPSVLPTAGAVPGCKHCCQKTPSLPGFVEASPPGGDCAPRLRGLHPCPSFSSPCHHWAQGFWRRGLLSRVCVSVCMFAVYMCVCMCVCLFVYVHRRSSLSPSKPCRLVTMVGQDGQGPQSF